MATTTTTAVKAVTTATATVETTGARAYTKYERSTLPAHPGDGWTRFVCIADTHSRTDWDVPSGDVLIHAGDLTRRGFVEQVQQTLEWIARLPHPTKIVIAGNHDIALDAAMVRTPSGARERQKALETARSEQLRERGVVYLDCEPATVRVRRRRWAVYGDPGTPRYGLPAFQYNSGGDATARFARVPDATEILVTHGPRAGVLDTTLHDVSAGCEELAARVANLPRLRLHVAGHIHEAHGVAVDARGLVSVNCALLWMGQPVVVDLNDAI